MNNDKYNFGDNKNNTYELHITGDAGYILVPETSQFCLCCGKEIEDGLYCDSDCRREYYASVRHELNSFEF